MDRATQELHKKMRTLAMGQGGVRTLQINYRVTAVDFGPSGLVYRCKALKRAPAGWSFVTLPSTMVPPGIVAGNTIEVTGLERRRPLLRIFSTLERTIDAVRRV